MAERGYGWEKLMSEMFCQEYTAERQMKTAIARKYTHMVQIVIQTPPLPVKGNS